MYLYICIIRMYCQVFVSSGAPDVAAAQLLGLHQDGTVAGANPPAPH
jgi:hypothetical protein